MNIITNNKPRELIYGYQLTQKEYQDFDYLGEYGSKEMQFSQFIRYKGEVYYLGDFVWIEKPGQRTNSFTVTDWDNTLQGWDGILTETFFSGIVIKWVGGWAGDSVIVGRVTA